MAVRRVAGMFCAAIAARAGREAEGDINLRLQLKKIARAAIAAQNIPATPRNAIRW